MTTIDTSFFTNKNIARVDVQQKVLVNYDGKKRNGFRVFTNDNSTIMDLFDYEMALLTKDFLLKQKSS